MAKKLLAVLAAAATVIIMTACGGGGGKVAGTFENVDGELLMFASDGSMRTIKGSDIGVGTFNTQGEDIELTYKGIARKYGYSLKDSQLILYSLGTTNEISTGVVYDKTAQGQGSVARSEAAIESLVGIYEDRAFEMAGGVLNFAYIFKDDGTYRHLENGTSANGTYTIDGNKLILKADDMADVWYAELRDGDLMLFSAGTAHSDGTYYKNVSTRYETMEAHYQEALEYDKTEQYEVAMNAFLSINEYWDSYTLGQEAGYKAACVFYDKKEYRSALKILNKLVVFDDYKSIYDECRKEVAKEDIALITFATTRKSNSMQQSQNYKGKVFEFAVDITNGSQDEVVDLRGNMNIYNNSDTQLMSVLIYNGDGIAAGKTRTLRLIVDAQGSNATNELYNTVLENLNIRFVLDSVTFEGTTYTNINQESTMHNAATVISMESDSPSSGSGTGGSNTTVSSHVNQNIANPQDNQGNTTGSGKDVSSWAYGNYIDGESNEQTIKNANDEKSGSFAGGNDNRNNYAGNGGGYLIPGSENSYIDENDLYGFDAWHCKLARNEIYARRGRMFLSNELQQYFNAQSWYRGTIPADSFDESILNKFEKANITTIRDYEKAHGYNQ